MTSPVFPKPFGTLAFGTANAEEYKARRFEIENCLGDDYQIYRDCTVHLDGRITCPRGPIQDESQLQDPLDAIVARQIEGNGDAT
jgi:hypothetical protein